jgi:hypothetical protein
MIFCNFCNEICSAKLTAFKFHPPRIPSKAAEKSLIEATGPPLMGILMGGLLRLAYINNYEVQTCSPWFTTSKHIAIIFRYVGLLKDN